MSLRVGTTDTASSLRGSRGVVAVVAGMAAMTILDLSKTAVALPSLERALGASALQLQLILGAYILAYAASLVVGGILGDAFGRRRTLTGALLVGLVAAVGATAAGSAEILIVFRVVQGIAAGLLMPQLLASLHVLLSGAARARAFGAYGATISAAIALGPVIGGGLLVLGDPTVSWRWLFAINIPPLLLALILIRSVLPADPPTRRARIDVVGIVLLSAAIVLILVPVTATSGTADDTPARWLLLAPGALLLACFALRQRARHRRGAPVVIPIELVRIPTLRSGLGVAAFWFASNLGLAVVITLYLQGAHGLTPLQAGLAAIPSAAAAAVAAAAAGRLVPRFGRAVVVGGLVVAMLGMALTGIALLVVPVDQRVVVVILTQIVTGLGGGATVSPNQGLTLGDVPKSLASAAGSLAQLSQRIGNAVGAAVAGAVLFATLYGAGATLTGAGEGAYAVGALAALIVCIAFTSGALVVAAIDLRRRRTLLRPDARVTEKGNP